jgi:hypothetical protein
MAGRSGIAGDVGRRAARLFAAILLVGGMAAGPVVHLSGDAGPPVAESQAGHEHGGSQLPDPHNDCPICMTLASAAVPMVPTVRAVVAAGTLAVAMSGSELRDRGAQATARARAPPLG